MGHKVNPNGFRLGITTSWTSNWYAEGKTYGENLLKDIQVRSYLRKKLSQASVSRIQIDRPSKSARVTRSEEHTSELQSLMRISYAVFCLKKKIQIIKLTRIPSPLISTS